jgi:hypothetical protein
VEDGKPILQGCYSVPLLIPRPGACSLHRQCLIRCTTSRTNIDSPKTSHNLSYLSSFNILARKTTSAIHMRRSPLITFHSSSCKPLLPNFFCSTLIVTVVLRFIQADILPTLLDTILTKTERARSPEVVAKNGCVIKCTSCLFCLALSCEFADNVSVFKVHASYHYSPLTRQPAANVRSGALSEHWAPSLKKS